MPNLSPQQFDNLILKLLENRISDKEAEVLAISFSNDVSLIKQYCEYVKSYTALQMKLSGEIEIEYNVLKEEDGFGIDLWKQALEYEKTSPAIEIPAEEPQQELIQKVVYPPQAKYKMSIFDKFTFIAAAAMTLFVVYLNYVPHKKAIPVATVSDGVNVEWLSPSGQITVGSELYPGPLTLNKGVAQIILKGGARVLLEAPVDIDLETSSRIYLKRGRLVANMEQSTEDRFVVRTANSTVVDYGTEFGVEFNKSGQTQAHVFRGTVELRQGSDLLKYDDKLRLEAGQAGRVEQTGKIDRIDAQPQQFISSLHTPYELSVKKTRPLYYWRFDWDQGRLLRNEMAAGLNGESKLFGSLGYIDGPNLGSGKNVALELTGRKEDFAVLRHCTDEADNARAFSIAMWIRPSKAGTESLREILSVRPEKKNMGQAEPVEPHLGNRSKISFTEKNTFIFTAFSPETSTLADQISDEEKKRFTHIIESNPVQLDKWYHVVAAYTNSHRMNLYVNGRLESSKPLPSDVKPLRPDAIWCVGARWTPSETAPGMKLSDSSFVGAVDEISQYNRELSAEEVRMLYASVSQK